MGKSKWTTRTKENDDKCVNKLKTHYQKFISSDGESPILQFLTDKQGITGPRMDFLRPFATVIVKEAGITLGRQEKRRRPLLIGWLNENIKAVEEIYPNMVWGEDNLELAMGPMADVWNNIDPEGPDREFIEAARRGAF
jgi:hypothetical protein